jgi:hypothetical protein
MLVDLQFQFEVRANVAEAMELGETARGRRRIIPIERGVVVGPKLSGTVLAGGADWQNIRRDGVAEIEARYTIQTDDGAFISVVNRGLRHGPPEIMRRLMAGDPVDPHSYYFRTAPIFDVAVGPYDWLTRSLFIGVGIRDPREVRIKVFAVG